MLELVWVSREAPHPAVDRGAVFFPPAVAEAPRQLQLVDMSQLGAGQAGVRLYPCIRMGATLPEPDRPRKGQSPRDIVGLVSEKEKRTAECHSMGTTPPVLCTP